MLTLPLELKILLMTFDTTTTALVATSPDNPAFDSATAGVMILLTLNSVVKAIAVSTLSRLVGNRGDSPPEERA